MDSSSPTDPSGDGPPARLPTPGREFAPLDVLAALVRERGLFLLVATPIVFFGTVYALTIPSQYTAQSTVVREATQGTESIPGNLPSIPGLGIDVGGARSPGLGPGAYPKILTSREVRLAVARDTFHFPGTGRRTSFVAHVNRPSSVGQRILNYTLGLPWTLKSWIEELFSQDSSPTGIDIGGDGASLVVPTDAEQEALSVLEDAVTATTQSGGALDEGSGLMTVSVTATNPSLAARLNQHFVMHLRRRVRELQTRNTQEQLEFVRQRFAEVARELERAEDSLAQFLERNRSVIAGGGVPTLSFRRDRLRRQVRFKEQLYGQLQEKVTQTRLRLQQQQPVITVAERPSPPPTPSAPNRLLIVVLSVVGASIIASLAVYARSLRTSVQADEGDRRKLTQIRKGLTVRGLTQGIRDELGRE
jgi:hypothetical protein